MERQATRPASAQKQKRHIRLGVHVHAFVLPDAKHGQSRALLNEVVALIESGKLRTTLNETVSPINAEILWAARAKVESGRTIGKLVLSEWAG